MAIAKIEDHEEQSQALLVDQYQEKPRIAAYLASFTQESQEFEDALWDVLILRPLDNAQHAQLDVIGKIVGEPRNDRPDEIYKPFIRARILVNRSEGHPSDIRAVVEAVLDGTGKTMRRVEYFPASFDVEIVEELLEIGNGVTTSWGTVLAELVRDSRIAGVHSTVITGPGDIDDPTSSCFVFGAAGVDEEADDYKGFSAFGVDEDDGTNPTAFGGLFSQTFE